MRWKYQHFRCFKKWTYKTNGNQLYAEEKMSHWKSMSVTSRKKLSYVSILDPHIRQQLPKVPNAQCDQNLSGVTFETRPSSFLSSYNCGVNKSRLHTKELRDLQTVCQRCTGAWPMTAKLCNRHGKLVQRLVEVYSQYDVMNLPFECHYIHCKCFVCRGCPENK